MQMTETFIPDFIEVLSSEGWIELKHYHQKTSVLTLDTGFNIFYLTPKVCSNYLYKGQLVQINTDTLTTYVKPSSMVVANETVCKAKDLKKGDLLNKFNLWSRIEHVEQGLWEGNLHSLFFGEPLFLPIRFEKDYCLLLV